MVRYLAGVGEATSAPVSQQATKRWTFADLLTASRLPLAVAFFVVDAPSWRAVILVVAGATDLLDGTIARRFGASRLGAFLDPVADKLFMVSAAGAVLLSGQLHPLELLGLLIRDIVATLAFSYVTLAGRSAAIPARFGGKLVTLLQMATLCAFLLETPLIHPLAWAATAASLYAIYDYRVVANRLRRRLD